MKNLLLGLFVLPLFSFASPEVYIDSNLTGLKVEVLSMDPEACPDGSVRTMWTCGGSECIPIPEGYGPIQLANHIAILDNDKCDDSNDDPQAPVDTIS
jgi:hypothetical protein